MRNGQTHLPLPGVDAPCPACGRPRRLDRHNFHITNGGYPSLCKVCGRNRRKAHMSDDYDLHLYMTPRQRDRIDMHIIEMGAVSRRDWFNAAILRAPDDVVQPRAQVNVHISPEAEARLRRFAADSGLSISEVARQIIDREIAP